MPRYFGIRIIAGSAREHPFEWAIGAAAAVGQEDFGRIGRTMRNLLLWNVGGHLGNQLRVSGVAPEILSQSAEENERQKLFLPRHAEISISAHDCKREGWTLAVHVNKSNNFFWRRYVTAAQAVAMGQGELEGNLSC